MTSNSKRGRRNRTRGQEFEREIVKMHRNIGIQAQRVPLSGAAGGAYSDDIDLYVFGPDEAPLVMEAKRRKAGKGFTLIERWLGESDGLWLRRDRAEPMVVLPWRVWEKLVK